MTGMAPIYAALLLHELGKPVTEENINKILQAAEANVDPALVKALINALQDQDLSKIIEEAKQSMIVTAATVAASTQAASGEEKKEEKKEEEKKEEKTAPSSEDIGAGLAALFG